jgi:hypothetical protein
MFRPGVFLCVLTLAGRAFCRGLRFLGGASRLVD